MMNICIFSGNYAPIEYEICSNSFTKVTLSLDVSPKMYGLT